MYHHNVSWINGMLRCMCMDVQMTKSVFCKTVGAYVIRNSVIHQVNTTKLARRIAEKINKTELSGDIAQDLAHNTNMTSQLREAILTSPHWKDAVGWCT